ncbi:unnamed protein product [Ectocarpus fasciculatus]
MEIPAVFRSFKVVRNQSDSPADCERMPKDVADAISLFLMTAQQGCAEKTRSCIETTLKILGEGPDGKRNVNVGTAAICWRCGYVGIPKNAELIGSQTADISTVSALCVCTQCDEAEDTNPICGKQPDGSVIPWIEFSHVEPGP